MRVISNERCVLSTITLFLSLLAIVLAHPAPDAERLADVHVHVRERSTLVARDWLTDLWFSWFPMTVPAVSAPAPAPAVNAPAVNAPAAKPTTTSSTSTKAKTTSSTKSSSSISLKITTGTSKISSSSTKTSSSTITSAGPKASSSAAVVVSESARGGNVAPSSAIPAAPVATKGVLDGGNIINTNTTGATNATSSVHANISSIATTLSSTILLIARDQASAYNIYSGLNAYGIPYQILIVPQSGAKLPALNSSATVGNFGGIVVLSEVSYDYSSTNGGFASALTTAQWTSLYAYQTAFGVRMVRLDVYPSADTGTTALGGCCDDGQEQLVSISNSKNFTQAGLKVGATLSTQGLYHYPAKVSSPGIAVEIAQFGKTSGYNTVSTAAVINTFAGHRQQMVFFMTWATSWSETSNFLQHAYITWMTRGLYAGYRRANFGVQIDDMFLKTAIYPANGTIFRLRPDDLSAIRDWTPKINAKMPAGSEFFVEVGHNGNGNIDSAWDADTTNTLCNGGGIIGSIQYPAQSATTEEFQKPLGSGTNLWPKAAPSAYPYSVACTNNDPLKTWWATPSNRDVFAHISHTFTHESENNATFYDIFNEISWNQEWLTQTSIASASRFSPKGLIPPAITGLHNGDAIRAWVVRSLTSAVGDNTRSALLNQINEHWPLMTTVAANGYDGVEIVPRWASNIYYNCDSAACTVQEWQDLTGQTGTFADIMTIERTTAATHVFALRKDSNMFHQANLRHIDVTPLSINGVTAKYSLLEAWVETAVNEVARLVTWPLITLKQDDLAAVFMDRMTRDGCGYNMQYTVDSSKKTIIGVTVTATSNSCSVPIPITVPGQVSDTQGFKTEMVGGDPLTIWVPMTGKPVSFTLSTPVAW